MTDSGSLHAQGAPGLGADKAALRRRLIAYRTSMPDREERLDRLLAVVGAWLAVRTETVIGGYWPIRGEPDLLPFLGSWMSGLAGRSVGLPVIDPDSSRLVYRGWHPGVRMQDDRFGIPTPEGTSVIVPQILLVPCVGFGPGGIRLGYGGGFFDRTLSVAGSQPLTVGIAFAETYVTNLPREPHDVPLDVVLTEEGVAWPPVSDRPIRVLFVCTHNSARSQIAEALLREYGGADFEAHSAGTEVTRVNPYAIRVLEEQGTDASGLRSKSITEFLDQQFDYVITVCDRARETCPYFPGSRNTLHWSLDDPSGVQGTDDQKLAAFQRTRHEVATRLRPFIEEALRAAGRPGKAQTG